MIKVKHVSSKDSWEKPKDGSSSWLEYWKNNSVFDYPSSCPDCESLINKNELVGAHVMKVDSYDKSIYIIPVCRGCNSKGSHEFTCYSFWLVPANKDKL